MMLYISILNSWISKLLFERIILCMQPICSVVLACLSRDFTAKDSSSISASMPPAGLSLKRREVEREEQRLQRKRIRQTERLAAETDQQR